MQTGWEHASSHGPRFDVLPPVSCLKGERMIARVGDKDNWRKGSCQGIDVQEMAIGARRGSQAKGSANTRENVSVYWKGMGVKPHTP